MEEWKQIPGLDVFYEASNTGKIQRQYKTKDKLLQGYQRRGRLVVKVKRNGRMVETSWAKLIWNAFHGPVPKGGYVRRKDCRRGYELDNLVLLSNKQKSLYMSQIKNNDILLAQEQLHDIYMSVIKRC
ncbi:NUMOD4 domain-containing protein [Culicoidibacter larvae]|uniref:NUMOD4 domain-containing protein n=1 Tax=Culicoidibacter larvae TaxID=2579976 RepID=A0A5R8Q7P4_9FIRM|nr:NUMOD4 domain-containing protein [Culicoidibacter larvae]TLG71151.1 hypothetical protein FEZ08_11395 [Culicoidibacter larvae]